MIYYDKLIFELSQKGRVAYSLPNNVWNKDLSQNLDSKLQRQELNGLPEVSEIDVVRHYTNLSQMNFGVDTGFYPLGSCTMKYNPKINEEIAALPGFTAIHPLQPQETMQGTLAVYDQCVKVLCSITGMADFTLAPAAGAHGELTGLMIMKEYHRSRGEAHRTKIIIPDSAHGTNPASAAVCGFDVVVVKSNAKGLVDVEDLKPLLDENVAGIMMTNPNTLGLFEVQIQEIAELVHKAGGLLYYDGANMNPLVGMVRPGDMGFDVLHLNLHKTFSTPHGGGGPGSGAVGVAAQLKPFLPGVKVEKNADGKYELVSVGDQSIGSICGFMGNFLVYLRALVYILRLGRENVKLVGRYATLSANYIQQSLKDYYKLPLDSICKHEFVFDGLIDDGARVEADGTQIKGATTLDVAKRLLDFGYHAPTIYFPLLFHQSIMIEPTETESKETIDGFIEVMKTIAKEAKQDPRILQEAPHSTPIRRPDETTAARCPLLRFMMSE